MNATCTQCQTIFRVDPAKIPESGVRARCSVCAGIFWVRREEPSAAAQAAPLPVSTPVQVQAPVPVPAPARVQAPAPFQAPAPVQATPPAPPPVASPRPAAAPVPPPAATPWTAPPAVAPPAPPPGGYPSFRPSAPPSPAFRAPAPPAPVPPPAYPAPAARPAAAVAVPQPPAASPQSPTRRPTNPFLSQDPEARARRLARALVSDIVVYHPAKRRDALRDGSLKLLFEEEIRKSWDEYVDQVGRELADSTTFFTDALNEILADGQPVFP